MQRMMFKDKNRNKQKIQSSEKNQLQQKSRVFEETKNERPNGDER